MERVLVDGGWPSVRHPSLARMTGMDENPPILLSAAMAREVPMTIADEPAPHLVVLLVFTDFQLLDATGPAEVFAAAGEQLPAGAMRPYRLRTVALEPGLVSSSTGLQLQARRCHPWTSWWAAPCWWPAAMACSGRWGGRARRLAGGGSRRGAALLLGVHRCLPACPRRAAGGAPGGDPLALCVAVAALATANAGTGGRAVRARRRLLQLGGCHGGHRPVPEPGGGGPGARGVPAGGPRLGGVPATAGRAASVQRRVAGPAGLRVGWWSGFRRGCASTCRRTWISRRWRRPSRSRHAPCTGTARRSWGSARRACCSRCAWRRPAGCWRTGGIAQAHGATHRLHQRIQPQEGVRAGIGSDAERVPPALLPLAARRRRTRGRVRRRHQPR